MSPKPYISTIIFDFDGTLADTATEIVATMTETFCAMGKPVPSEDDMRRTIGMKLQLALQQLANLTDAEAIAATAYYKTVFMERGVQRVGLFPQVSQTLLMLKQRGVRMAIATSRNSPSLEQILSNNGVSDCFETMVTNSDHLAPKPDPQMVLTLLERMHITPGETLVVGDTTYDIEMGNRAGCYTCAVTWGNHSRETLKSSLPNFVIDSVHALPDLFETKPTN